MDHRWADSQQVGKDRRWVPKVVAAKEATLGVLILQAGEGKAREALDSGSSDSRNLDAGVILFGF